MTLVLAVLGVATVASAIWLTVRIINRRERWAKWTAAVLAVPMMYLLSMGPILWMDLHGLTPVWTREVPLYWPVQWVRENGPEPMRNVINQYLALWFP